MNTVTIHDFDRKKVESLIKGDLEYFDEDFEEAKSNYKFIDLTTTSVGYSFY